MMHTREIAEIVRKKVYVCDRCGLEFPDRLLAVLHKIDEYKSSHPAMFSVGDVIRTHSGKLLVVTGASVHEVPPDWSKEEDDAIRPIERFLTFNWDGPGWSMPESGYADSRVICRVSDLEKFMSERLESIGLFGSYDGIELKSCCRFGEQVTVQLSLKRIVESYENAKEDEDGKSQND